MIKQLVEYLAKFYHNYIFRIQKQYSGAIYRYVYYKTRPIIQNMCTNNTVSQTDADTEKILWVNPATITHDAKLGPRERGAVCGGCWDWKISKFQNNYQCRSLIAHFTEGKSWEQTEYFKRQLSVIERDGKWRGCDNKKDLLEFLNKYDKLYYNLRTDGYDSQQELSSKSEEVIETDQKTPRNRNEIGINIGRDGELMWRSNGRHRLCLAQILELDAVSVQVLTRHEQWQAKRDQIRSTSNPNRFPDEIRLHLDHPDLNCLKSFLP